MEPVRIFIASPSDVAEERQLAYRAIERLRLEFAERADLQALIWEHEPLLATSDFQSQIGTPANSDIFVLLLWARFGSPLGSQFVRSDGSRYASATEYEFEEAMASFRASGHPRMLVYRKMAPVKLKDDSARAQNAAVDQFFDKWFLNADDNTAKAAYHAFTEPGRFEDILELHLRKVLLDFLPNPNNLPVAANTFVGRRELTGKVCELLSLDDSRLVVLVGPGGTGKTRFSLHLGNELLPQFHDGVFFISLASVTDPELVPSTIASTMGIKDSDEFGVEGIIRELKRKKVLLIIDNLEQVQSAGKYIGAILNECPDVKAIVTSREAMRLTSAKTIHVPPLELPDVEDLPPLAELHEVEAVRLFVTRANAVRDDFELTDDNARHVVEICKRVDALPLAIELAASRIRTMSPERLSQALTQRFKVLTGGADDLLAHQKSLRELIAWSYDLLDESEQRLWQRLAVFSDGCGIEDAQEVCDPDNDYFIELDVEALVDKSLVNIRVESDSTNSRISMLESLREFAREKLVESSEFELIQDRFCKWCDGIGFVNEDTSLGSDFETCLNRLDAEQNNLRSALDYCLSEGKAEEALHLCGCLYQYWYTRGFANEGIQWIEKTLKLNNKDETETKGRALKGFSTLLRGQDRLEEAARYADEALATFSKIDNNKMRASALCELGAIAQRRGEFDVASGFLEECISLARAENVSDHNLSYYLIVQGVTEHLMDNLPEAKKLYVESLSIGRESGDKTRTATALLNLGEIIEAEGKFRDAYSHYRDSLALWIELKHKQAIARCAEVIAGLEVRINERPYEAAFLLGAAESIREVIDVPVEPFNLQTVNDDIALTRDALDTDAYEAAWNAGRGLKVEGVLRHVIGGQLTEAPAAIEPQAATR